MSTNNVDYFLLEDLMVSVDACLESLTTQKLAKDAYANSGVTGTASFAGQLGPTSAAVLLTDGKKKKIKKSDAAGLEGATVDGKKLKITGLSEKEKDEYLFGSAKLKKVIDDLDRVISALEGMNRPLPSDKD